MYNKFYISSFCINCFAVKCVIDWMKLSWNFSAFLCPLLELLLTACVHIENFSSGNTRWPSLPLSAQFALNTAGPLGTQSQRTESPSPVVASKHPLRHAQYSADGVNIQTLILCLCFKFGEVYYRWNLNADRVEYASEQLLNLCILCLLAVASDLFTIVGS